MSAFDITGAAIATPIAVMFLSYCLGKAASPLPDPENKIGGAFWAAIPFMAWATFCIARLCGASL